MATEAGGIYNIDTSSQKEKQDAIIKYNSITGNSLPYSTVIDISSSWNKINNIKDKIYKYYEYLQFKRAKFDCKNVEYDKNTGRVISMTFAFTGKFE